MKGTDLEFERLDHKELEVDQPEDPQRNCTLWKVGGLIGKIKDGAGRRGSGRVRRGRVGLAIRWSQTVTQAGGFTPEHDPGSVLAEG
jgi:hypothetical protein